MAKYFTPIAAREEATSAGLNSRLNQLDTAIDARLVGSSFYQTGTWIPRLVGLTTPGAPTYGAQSGQYVKIGAMVYVSLYFVVTALGGATGQLRVEGLPFPSAISVQIPLQQTAALDYYGAIGTVFGGGSANGIIFRKSATNANVTAADLTGMMLIAGFWYRAVS